MSDFAIERGIERNSTIVGPLSAFGDLRVAELSPIFQGSFEYTVDNTDLLVNAVVNSGTVTQATGCAIVGTGTTTGSFAYLKSKQHAKYHAGLGGLMRFTALFTTGVAGTFQFAGLADEIGSSSLIVNGYGVGFSGETFAFLRYQNDVTTTIAQSAWDDPMDGTGASGMTLDPTKLNVFFVQFQYLGAGAITLWVEDQATGLPAKVHTISYTNQNTVPSVYNPNFHFSIVTINLATISDVEVSSASYAYFVEGKTEYIELHQPINSSGLQESTSVTTEIAVFTIRNKTSYQSKTNFIDIILQGMVCSIDVNAANNLGTVRLVKNMTIGGSPSWSDINTANSVIELDTAGTVSGGVEIIPVSLAGRNDSFHIDLSPHKIILNPGDTLTLTGKSGTSATIDGALLWRELF